MRKAIKYIIIIAVAGLLGFQSVYFRKLSVVQQEKQQSFDAVAFSKKLWEEKLPAKMDSAISLPDFIQAVAANQQDAFSKYTNALGIGNYRYALIKANGQVSAVNEDEVILQISAGDSTLTAILATEYIYGNAIRDASGLVDVKDFPNTAELNSISEELNKLVRTSVLPDFRKQVKTGDQVQVVAAVEFNKEHVKWQNLELLPLRLQINQ
jgi:predicted lipoprotein